MQYDFNKFYKKKPVTSKKLIYSLLYDKKKRSKKLVLRPCARRTFRLLSRTPRIL